jgi:uncharacterized protein (DUF2141 family)
MKDEKRIFLKIVVSLSVLMLFFPSAVYVARTLPIEIAGTGAYLNYEVYAQPPDKREMPLFYTWSGVTCANIRPLVAYVSTSGTILDFLFTGMIYYDSALYCTHNPTQSTCDQYVNALTAELTIINSVVAEVKTALSQPNFKWDIVLTVPYAVGSNVATNCAAVMSRWNEINPSNLRLVGFYWGYTEAISDVGSVIITTASYVHSQGLEFYWIPYLQNYATSEWLATWHDVYGFDHVTEQPNYAFSLPLNTSRFAQVNKHLIDYGLDGVEFEFCPSNGLSEEANANAYFDAAEQYQWYNDKLNTWFHGAWIATASTQHREIYDRIYSFVKRARAGPTGSILIDEGAAYTTSEEVTLTLTYADAASDASQVRYSNDGVWDTEVWETPAPTRSWTLTPGDGGKTVYYQIKDNADLISPTYSDTITLDASTPTGSIVINSNAAYATSTATTLTLTYGDVGGSGVDKVRYSNDGSAWTGWETASGTNPWTLSSGGGSKTVYYQVRDNAGNMATFSDRIVLDTTAPTGLVSINSGATYTSSTRVTLTISATDPNGVAEMAFSTDGIAWDSWEAYGTSKSWTLTGTDGNKTVCVRFRDNAGLESSVCEGKIILDNVAPVTNDDYDGLWHTSDFAAALSASDGISGVSDIYYKVNGEATKTVGVDGQPQITTESATNSLEYWSVDEAGNEESHHILTNVKLDKTIPTGSVVISNGSPYTNSTSVTLNLTASDNCSGVYRVRFSNDGMWDDEQWEALSSSKSWNLTSGDGSKAVYFQVKDYARLSRTCVGTVVLDTTEPSVAAPSRVPSDRVQPNQSAIISVNVTDSGCGVKSVRLTYFINASARYASTSGLEFSMKFNQTSGLYEYTIAGQGRGTLVKYEITAFDNAGNSRTDDNAGEYYTYTVRPLFDLNGDGRIDMKDISIAAQALAQAFYSIPGSPNWNPIADLSGDGKVDMKDISIAAQALAQAFYSIPGSPNWNPIADLSGDGKVDMKDISIVTRRYC